VDFFKANLRSARNARRCRKWAWLYHARPVRTTLSGGSATHQARQGTLNAHRPHALYIGRATTGLHSEDIRKLLLVLHKLVDAGNTVVVIEHNLDVIKTADWIIDIGPARQQRRQDRSQRPRTGGGQ